MNLRARRKGRDFMTDVWPPPGQVGSPDIEKTVVKTSTRPSKPGPTPPVSHTPMSGASSLTLVAAPIIRASRAKASPVTTASGTLLSTRTLTATTRFPSQTGIPQSLLTSIVGLEEQILRSKWLIVCLLIIPTVVLWTVRQRRRQCLCQSLICIFCHWRCDGPGQVWAHTGSYKGYREGYRPRYGGDGGVGLFAGGGGGGGDGGGGGGGGDGGGGGGGC